MPGSNRNAVKSAAVLAGLAAVGLLAGNAGAAVIAEHVGSADPATEGWGRFGGSTNEGPVAGPTPAWNIGGAGNGPNYVQSTSAAENEDAFDNGWVLTANVRVNDVNKPLLNGDLAANVEYATDAGSGSDRWFLTFGSDANGDPQVKVGFQAQPVYTEVGGAGKFNLFELVWDAAAGNADLFVNGTERMSNLTAPNPSTLSRVLFGGNNGGANPGVREVDYALVRLETVPEPASLALLGLGAACLVARRRDAA